MMKCNLFKLLLLWNFIIKWCVKFILIFLDTAKQDFVIKTREMFSFLLLINNVVTTRLSLLLLSISAIISSKRLMFYTFYLGCNLQCFSKYHPYHLNIK